MLAAVLLATAAVAARADIYRCTSVDGVPLFTNVPADPRCRTVVQSDRRASPAPVTQVVLDRAARRVTPVDRARWDPQIRAAARLHGVDAALIHAVISAESAYDPFARSAQGARGLMQLIPATGARYGATNLLDPAQNIDAGTRYLKDLIAQFGKLELALAAYNAGEGAVQRHGAIPPYPETRAYVPKVLAYYKRYRPAPVAKTRAAYPLPAG
jgi:soluble lytic murein transglycosylase-like protein